MCNACKAITAKVTLSPIDLEDSLGTPIVLESENGKYSVLFTPKRYRNHVLSIQINGNHITGSPAELEIDVKNICKPSYYEAAKEWSSKAPYTTVTNDKPFSTTSNMPPWSRSRSTVLPSEIKHYYSPHSFQPSASKPKRFSYS